MTTPSPTTHHVTVPTGADEDVTVAYHVAGEGPPLVCLHGIGLDAGRVGWRDAPAALGEAYTIYAVDLPNHGDSGESDAVKTTADYVAVFGEILDAIGLSRPTLAGLSMGGAVALGHVLEGGDVAGLVLVDSYGLGADAPWRSAGGMAVRLPFADDLFTNALSTRAGVRSTVGQLVGGAVPEGLVDDVHAAADATSLRAMRRWQRHEFRPDGLRTNYRERLSEIDVPTLLIHGEADPLVPVSWSSAAEKRLSDAELVRLPGVGHWPPREAPADVYDAVLARF